MKTWQNAQNGIRTATYVAYGFGSKPKIIKGLYPNHMHIFIPCSKHQSKQSVENWKRSCAHKVPSIFSSERSTELEDSIISLEEVRPQGTQYFFIWKVNWTWRFHNKSIESFIRLQRQVTPKCLIQSGWNSNSSETLCLSWLPESLTKIWSKMNKLAWDNIFPRKVLGEFFKGT